MRKLLPLSIVFIAAPVLASPPTLETVLQRHFDAQGGLARLKAINSVVTVSTDSFDGKTSTYANQKLRPNLWRTEVTEPGGVVTVKGFDGQNGWVMKDGSVELATAEKSAMMKAKSSIDDPLVDPAARGYKVELAGTETVDGVPTYVISMKGESDSQRRYIDAKTFLEVKRVTSFTYEGKPAEKTARFSNWKTVNGVTVAGTVEYTRDGKKGSYTLTKIELDAPLRATAFAAPAAPQKAPTVQAAATK